MVKVEDLWREVAKRRGWPAEHLALMGGGRTLADEDLWHRDWSQGYANVEVPQDRISGVINRLSAVNLARRRCTC